MNDPVNPAFVENLLLMRKEDFSELLNLAAERGARAVLAELGLSCRAEALPGPPNPDRP
jgi:hypothetical protein